MFFYIFLFLFYIFCLKWCGEVISRFGKDLSRLIESYWAERFAIVLVWILTIPLLAYAIYFSIKIIWAIVVLFLAILNLK